MALNTQCSASSISEHDWKKLVRIGPNQLLCSGCKNVIIGQHWCCANCGECTCPECLDCSVKAKTKIEAVNHPQHYNPGVYEAINIIEAYKLGFNLGNAVKYILRSDKKGKRLEDLQKAQWYINREIENGEKGG